MHAGASGRLINRPPLSVAMAVCVRAAMCNPSAVVCAELDRRRAPLITTHAILRSVHIRTAMHNVPTDDTIKSL